MGSGGQRLSVFSYWFDGLTALAAIVAAVVLRLLREMPTKKDVGGRSSGIGAKATKIVTGVVTWIFLVGVVGRLLARERYPNCREAPPQWDMAGGEACAWAAQERPRLRG